MKAIGVIPARFNSTRFPGKPLFRISGKSLIERVYNRAILANLQKVVIATDDERIMDEALSFGAQVALTGEHTSGTDRVAEAIQEEECDIVINIQGDEPLIKPEVIDTVIEALGNNSWAEVSSAATKIHRSEEIDDPNAVKVVFTREGRSLYFSRSRIPFNKNEKTNYYKHIGIYGYRKDFLMKYVSLRQSSLEAAESLEQLRILENGYSIHLSIVDYDSIGVDTPEDAQRVEEMLIKEGKV